jgi:hypothetical protein
MGRPIASDQQKRRAVGRDGTRLAALDQDWLLTNRDDVPGLNSDRLGEANTIQALGDVARLQDRYDEATERYQQALPIYRQIGARLGEANTLVSRARLAIASGERAQAASEMAEAIRIYRAIGLNQWAEAFQSEAANWEAYD